MTAFKFPTLQFDWQDEGGAAGWGHFTFDGLRNLEGMWGFHGNDEPKGLWDLSPA